MISGNNITFTSEITIDNDINNANYKHFNIVIVITKDYTIHSLW